MVGGGGSGSVLDFTADDVAYLFRIVDASVTVQSSQVDDTTNVSARALEAGWQRSVRFALAKAQSCPSGACLPLTVVPSAVLL
jgi:hypothetical protein